MLFSGATFLYYFLPLVLTVYFICPRGLKNPALLLFSLVFYAWGEPKYVLVMLFSIVSSWLLGFVIDKYRGAAPARAALATSVALGLGMLAVFKYADFFISNANGIFGADIPLLRLALPVGISFYTFQVLSYTVDLYRGQVRLQRSFVDYATYVALFPQLVAGPIVRYATVAKELESRKHTLMGFSSGVLRFATGLGKKVLLANVLGELCQIYRQGTENTVLFAWLYAVAYGLHIYFDFSGYSDMAIGLGRMFGFSFDENFNYPFISKSITEFWRRWHISLSSWFRDYVYIPLGGNRVSPGRQALNIAAVWLLTGLWHGAGWNFIVWGLYFGALLLVEKFALKGRKLPALPAHTITMLLVLISWILFDAPTLPVAIARIGRLAGVGTDGLAGSLSLYYLRSYAVPLICGIIGCTPLPATLAGRLAGRKQGLALVLEPAYVALLLIACTAYLIDGSFNPFIYFRF